MGWSPFVSRSHGYPKGRQADELDKWAAETSARNREKAKASQPMVDTRRTASAWDTLELSSRQLQTPALQPVPIITTSGFLDYSA